MDFIYNFISNNYVLVTGLVVLIVTGIFKFVSKRTGIPSNITDAAAIETIKVVNDELSEIKEKSDADKLANPVIKEGIAIKPKRAYKKKKVITSDGE